MKAIERKIIMKRYSNLMASVGWAVAIQMLSGCDSSDLGHETGTRVPIDFALTDWNSGVETLIAMKCASCHTSERGNFVPANTPHTLDGIQNKSFFEKSENLSTIKSMQRRINTDEEEKRMPPRFATELYPEERFQLRRFLDASVQKLKLELNQAETAADGSQPKPASGSGPVAGENQNQNPPTPPPPGTPEVLNFAVMKPLTDATCAKSGCHTGQPGAKFPLLTLADFQKNAKLAIEMVSGAEMPKDNVKWGKSKEGQMFLKWLATGPKE
jgi:hypothetical protein